MVDDDDKVATGNGDGRTDGAQAVRTRRSPLLHVCPFILGCEFGERLAFYGILTNLVVYLLMVGFTNLEAATLVPLFVGSCYVTPLLGGYLADTWLGRYKTILYCALIYVMGIALLTLSAGVKGLHPEENERINRGQAAFLFFSLALIALGTGGIKPNVSSFGADHFDENNPQEKGQKDSFFNWFYLAINIGSLVASTVIVYVEVNISWALGFLLTGIAMALAVIVLVLGSPSYQHREVAESPLARIANIVAAALIAGGPRQLYRHGNAAGGAATSDSKPLLADHTEDGDGRHQDQEDVHGAIRNPRPHWLDAAIGNFTREQVDEAKLVLGVMPVFFTTVLYWTVYSQMSTLFVQQGTLMNLSLGRYTIPAASLSVFDVLAIVVLVPIYDRLIVPLLRQCNREPTQLQRIGAGYAVAMVTMVISFAIERERLRRFKEGDIVAGQETHSEAQAVDMSVWWQVFQYLGIGTSEVLSAIGQLNFFYNQAPTSMRSCMMAVQLLSGALGSYSASLLVLAINHLTESISGMPWIPADLNCGRLDLMYLTLGGIMLVDTIWFVHVAMRYEYKEVVSDDAPRQMGIGPDPSAAGTGEDQPLIAPDVSTSENVMGASEV
eukprot:evm.model.scf_534.10 EVM.evm.TU.scf_534.10   scf_534:53976-59558(+)